MHQLYIVFFTVPNEWKIDEDYGQHSTFMWGNSSKTSCQDAGLSFSRKTCNQWGSKLQLELLYTWLQEGLGTWREEGCYSAWPAVILRTLTSSSSRPILYLSLMFSFISLLSMFVYEISPQPQSPQLPPDLEFIKNLISLLDFSSNFAQHVG